MFIISLEESVQSFASGSVGDSLLTAVLQEFFVLNARPLPGTLTASVSSEFEVYFHVIF